jgi:hypothetical protein
MHYSPETDILLIPVVLMDMFIEIAIIKMIRKHKKDMERAPMFNAKQRTANKFLMFLKIILFYIVPIVLIIVETGRPKSWYRNMVLIGSVAIMAIDLISNFKDLSKK